MSAVGIRPATPADVDAIARFHVAVWRETYRDIAPKAAWKALGVERRRPSWARVLGESDGFGGALLAEDDGRITGLASFARPSHPAFDGMAEITHLYVDASRRGEGLGRRLLEAALEKAAAAGFPGAGLAVVRENRAARDFYQALGGVETVVFTDPGPLWRSDNIVVAWTL